MARREPSKMAPDIPEFKRVMVGDPTVVWNSVLEPGESYEDFVFDTRTAVALDTPKCEYYLEPSDD